MTLTRTVEPASQPTKRSRNQPCGKLPVVLAAPATTNAVLPASTRQVLPPPVKFIEAAPEPVAVVPANALTAAKLATTTLFAVMLVILQDAPVQSPLNAVKVKPAFAVAVQLALPPFATVVGVQVTEPPVSGLAVLVTVRLPTATNDALTVQLTVTVPVV